MLTLWSDRAESLWDEALPVEVLELGTAQLKIWFLALGAGAGLVGSKFLVALLAVGAK